MAAFGQNRGSARPHLNSRFWRAFPIQQLTGVLSGPVLHVIPAFRQFEPFAGGKKMLDFLGPNWMLLVGWNRSATSLLALLLALDINRLC
jgi:hypothetical protein